MIETYSDRWFETRKKRARESAQVVLPIVFDLVAPSSIVDLGCGTGSWLVVASNLGVRDVVGLDAHHVDSKLLEISADQFIHHDLTTRPAVGRTFDLALCLEVGEHLPARSASTLVQSLTELAPVVLFSAAVPGQGGTAHVNEQWPDYWADLFVARGYRPYDAIRMRVWRDNHVGYFYAQNSVLYVRDSVSSRYPRLPAPLSYAPPALVHPKLLARARDAFPPVDDVALGSLIRFGGKWLALHLISGVTQARRK